MDTLEFMKSRTDVSRQISLDDESIDAAFRMIAENIEDVLAFDGVDIAELARKGKVFG